MATGNTIDKTPGQAFPVPTNNMDPDIPDDMWKLARAVEKRVMAVYADVAARDTATASVGIEQGMFAFLRSDNTVYYWNGSAWIKLIPAVPMIYSGPSVPGPGVGNNNDVFFQI
jgi:hypothetical protein